MLKLEYYFHLNIRNDESLKYRLCNMSVLCQLLEYQKYLLNMKVLVSRVLDMVREKRDTEEPLFLLCLETLQRLYIHRGKKKLTFFFQI